MGRVLVRPMRRGARELAAVRSAGRARAAIASTAEDAAAVEAATEAAEAAKGSIGAIRTGAGMEGVWGAGGSTTGSCRCAAGSDGEPGAESPGAWPPRPRATAPEAALAEQAEGSRAPRARPGAVSGLLRALSRWRPELEPPSCPLPWPDWALPLPGALPCELPCPELPLAALLPWAPCEEPWEPEAWSPPLPWDWGPAGAVVDEVEAWLAPWFADCDCPESPPLDWELPPFPDEPLRPGAEAPDWPGAWLDWPWLCASELPCASPDWPGDDPDCPGAWAALELPWELPCASPDWPGDVPNCPGAWPD